MNARTLQFYDAYLTYRVETDLHVRMFGQSFWHEHGSSFTYESAHKCRVQLPVLFAPDIILCTHASDGGGSMHAGSLITGFPVGNDRRSVHRI